MLKKTFVCSWLLLALSGCPIDSAGTDDTKTTGNDDSKTDDDEKPDDTPPDDDDDDDDVEEDEESPSEETPVDPDPSEDAGTDPGPPDGGTETDLDASTDETLDAAVPDAGDSVDVDANVTPDAGSAEEDAGPPIEVPDLGAADMLPADRAALVFQVMTAQNYRDTWQPLLQETTGPRALVVNGHGAGAVRLWVNPVAAAAVKTWTDNGMPLPLVLPNGSIVVKEIYKLDMVTGLYTQNGINIMSKVSALDETAYEGDWFYSKVSTTNETSASTTCANCHNGRSAKAVWPADPNVVGSGGMPDGLVPYDYLFVTFCADPLTPQCAAPGGEIPLPM
jgi:hypothetical protein